MKKQIPVWECPRCSYVMTAKNEIGDEEELLAEFERVGQTIAEGERDPEPGEIAQCFRCGKFAVIGEDLQLRMPTTDEQLAINTNAHLTESQIVWASFTGARRNEQTTSGNVPNNSTERAQTERKRGESIRANNVTTKDRFTITYDPDSYTVTVTKQIKVYDNFDSELAAGHELLHYFRQTKPGREWLCDKVSYDILRRIGLVRINKSGVDAHSFQKGIAVCVGKREHSSNQ